jgi:hypothetical protein
MPDVFALSGIQSLARLRTPELEVAVADDDADAKASSIAKLAQIDRRLEVSRGLLDALEGRSKLRRPLPPLAPLESVQSLVRRGRRRLERERQGGTRTLLDLKRTALVKLRTVLET